MTSKPPGLLFEAVLPAAIKPPLPPDHSYWKVWCYGCAQLQWDTLLEDYVKDEFGPLGSEFASLHAERSRGGSHHPDCPGNLARACAEAAR